jgi:hypothetical protein
VQRLDLIGDCAKIYFAENDITVYKFVCYYIIENPELSRVVKVLAALEADVLIPVYIDENHKEENLIAVSKKTKERRKYSILWDKTYKIMQEVGAELETYIKKCNLLYDEQLGYWRLDKRQKEEVALIFLDKLKEIDDCADYYAVIKEKIAGIRKYENRYRIVADWKTDEVTGKSLDGAVRGTRRMQIVQKGTLIDRTGGNGMYFSPMNESGYPYTLKQRAIGAVLKNEELLEENTCYHRYKVLEDFTRDNFEKAVKRSGYADEAKLIMYVKLDRYYYDILRADSECEHPGEAYGDIDSDGIKTGTIDNMFFCDDGGGIQYIMPFTTKQLETLGMIQEV